MIPQLSDKGSEGTDNDRTYIDSGKMEKGNIHISKRAEAEKEIGDLKKDKGEIHALTTSAWTQLKCECKY